MNRRASHASTMGTAISFQGTCWLLGIALGLSFSIGCQTAPDLGPPGTMEAQRIRALQNDPFPNNDIAPQIFSSRPVDFDRPRDEASELQSNGRRGLNF